MHPLMLIYKYRSPSFKTYFKYAWSVTVKYLNGANHLFDIWVIQNKLFALAHNSGEAVFYLRIDVCDSGCSTGGQH